jgi:hypothetical protein
MADITAAGVFSLGNIVVNRLGYGAMQLAGPGVFGPAQGSQCCARRVARGRGEYDRFGTSRTFALFTRPVGFPS